MRQIFAGLKGALAMEIDHAPRDFELPYLLREVCGAAWRARARKALGKADDDDQRRDGAAAAAESSPAARRRRRPSARAAAADDAAAVDPAADASPSPYPTLATLIELRETGVASGVLPPPLLSCGAGVKVAGPRPGRPRRRRRLRLRRRGRVRSPPVTFFPRVPTPWATRRLRLSARGSLVRAADAVDRRARFPVEEVQALMEEGRRLKIDSRRSSRSSGAVRGVLPVPDGVRAGAADDLVR